MSPEAAEAAEGGARGEGPPTVSAASGRGGYLWETERLVSEQTQSWTVVKAVKQILCRTVAIGERDLSIELGSIPNIARKRIYNRGGSRVDKEAGGG